MTFKKERNWLTIVWFGFLILNCSIIFYLYLTGWIEDDNYVGSLKEINTLYAPYLGAMTTYFWSRSRQSSDATSTVGSSFITLAMIGSLIWNGMILALMLGVVFELNSIEAALRMINSLANIFSWLVAGAMGYYFSSASSENRAS